MNYIQEINAFYARVETNPLSGSAVCLWHTLMHVNNRAHWVDEFTVAASVLCSKSGLASSTFKRARTELKEKGYIQVTSRGTKAPIYRIMSLCRVVEVGLGCGEQEMNGDVSQVGRGTRDADQDIAEVVDQGMNQVSDQVPDQGVDPLIKLNNKKQKNTISSTATYILEFYNDNFGKVTNYIKSEIDFWSNELGDELVFEALKRTIENGKTTWRYTLGILHKWKKDGLRTVHDVMAAEEAFRQRRGMSHAEPSDVMHSGYEDASRALFYGGKTGRYTPHKQQRTEVIPDWFRELKEKKEMTV